MAVVVLGVGRSLFSIAVLASVLVFVVFATYQASPISNRISNPVFRTWQLTVTNFVYGAWNASASSASFLFNSRFISRQIHRLEDGVKGKRRVAICLVGAARTFELSGGSLKKYVLDAYTDADVFLHSPLDKDSYKFLLLKGVSNLTAARIFIPEQLPESYLAREVLTSANSPNGIQGLLQYFKLVEGCLQMIENYEMQHNIRYGWIIRTRVDAYWSGQIPPLESLDPSFYYVPSGSQYGGLNDRFGMGNANTSRAALARLSLLPLLHSRGRKQLNSETAFKAQLVESQIPFKFIELPFCILSTRKYSWPPSFWGVPVTSINTKGPLNGSKCRPCTPRASGSEAQDIVDKLSKDWGWPGLIEGLQLCDAQGDWELHWEGLFPKTPGFNVSLDMSRMQNMTLNDCIQEIENFQRQWEVWDAPTAKKLCEQRLS